MKMPVGLPVGDMEPTETELRQALATNRDEVVAWFEERIVESEETTAEGLSDLRAYKNDYDFSKDDDIVILWDDRFGLAE